MSNKKLLIGFYASGIPFHGNTITEKSLGGSETAVLYMARELAKRGHDVKVFNNCDKPGNYDGVDYNNFNDSWENIAPIAEWDVFIVSRNYQMMAHKMHTRMLGLWNHDILVDEASLMNNSWACDFSFCLSDFHVEQFLSVAKDYRSITHKTRNGVDLELIDSVRNKNLKRDPNIFVWGSRPERGLDILLQKTWPRILKDVNPNAKLLIAGYSLADIKLPDVVVEFNNMVDKIMAHSKNVEQVGNLTKEKWYELLCSSGQMLYCTNFPEISCINALEAQACGIPIVTTNNFALVETVADKKNLINHDPRSDEYQSAFVARVKRLYSNEYEYKQSQHAGRARVESKYEWKTIAAEWEDFFWNQFKKRSLKNGGRNVLKNFAYHSDLLAVKWVAEHVEETGIDRKECSKVISETNVFLSKHHDDPEEYGSIDQGIDFERRISRFDVAFKSIKKHFGDKPFTLVDVGCGVGRFTGRALLTFPNQVQVMGLDFSQTLIDRACKQLKANIKGLENPESFMLVADFMQFPIPEEKVDCIFAGEWLEHQTDIHAALERLESWVKPGGLIVLTVPSGPWEAISYKKYESTYKDKNYRDHVSHFEFRDIEELFSTKQFKMEYVPITISNIDGSLLGNWVIYYSPNNAPYGEINYLRKFQTMRPYQSISACIIMRDEEDNISGFLKSLRPVVDEIVCVDTGSQDSTIQIAKQFADKVVEIEWPEDFGEARNISISHADPEADWTLWGDCDERLLFGERLRKYLNSEMFNGYVLLQQHLISDIQDVKPDTPVRIYKNNIGIKFYGVIHEHCESALDVPINPVLILPDVKFVHYGYTTEAIRRRKCRERNLPLLKKDREKYPNRQLGVVLMMRDYLNMSQWSMEESHGEVTDPVFMWLKEVVRCHRQYFNNPKHLYYNLSYALYQRALVALGKNNLPASDKHQNIPFEIAYSMGGGLGGIQEPEKIGMQMVWFADREELEEWLEWQTTKLLDGLKLPKGKY